MQLSFLLFVVGLANLSGDLAPSGDEVVQSSNEDFESGDLEKLSRKEKRKTRKQKKLAKRLSKFFSDNGLDDGQFADFLEGMDEESEEDFVEVTDSDEDATPTIANGFKASDAMFKGSFTHLAYISAIVDGNLKRCTGSIISDRWILTAAHCIVEGPMKVRVGTPSTSRGGQEFVVAEKYIHPGYKEGSNDGFSHPNDIALLRIDGNIIFKKGEVEPTKLASRDTVVSDGEDLWSAGWGFTTAELVLGDDLQFATFKTMNTAKCQERTRAYVKYLASYIGVREDLADIGGGQICVVGNAMNGAAQSRLCGGDSGGPLWSRTKGQIGLVSYGYPKLHGNWFTGYYQGNGCESDVPAVLTRISEYTDWIYSYAGGAINQPPVKPMIRDLIDGKTPCRVHYDEASIGHKCDYFQEHGSWWDLLEFPQQQTCEEAVNWVKNMVFEECLKAKGLSPNSIKVHWVFSEGGVPNGAAAAIVDSKWQGRSGSYGYLRQGHCADRRGWFSGNTREDSLDACTRRCDGTTACNHVAYNADSGQCAIYNTAACPNDGKYMDYAIYKKPLYYYAREGHCAEGWIKGNSKENLLNDCERRCNNQPGCTHLAFNVNTKVCAIYNSPNCPDDRRFLDYRVYAKDYYA